jgi:hypothetical protein
VINAGQRAVFSPLISDIHGMISLFLEKKLGPGVWEHYEQVEISRMSYQSELGPLAFFLKEKIRPAAVLKLNVINNLVDLAFAWREIRNISAHSKMVGFASLEKGVMFYLSCQEFFAESDPLLISCPYDSRPTYESRSYDNQRYFVPEFTSQNNI